MDFWKSLWPISSIFSPPLLLRSTTDEPSDNIESPTQKIGPLIFNPSPQTLTQLFSSPSLSSPSRLPPYLSLPRFLHTSTPLLPSTSFSIASEFGLQPSSPNPTKNCLQLLHCNGTNLVLAFFPTGTNSDQVGFLLLVVKDSNLCVKAFGESGGEVFTSKESLGHKIINLSVNPLAEAACFSGNSSHSTVGYLLACTMYSVHWYNVRIRGLGSVSERPTLDFLGSKLFKTGVVHACWNPHIQEESLVLLESGELFLFDLDSCNRTGYSLPGKKLKLLWDYSSLSEKGTWLSCEFSWHPRILIIAHSAAVFLVDLRSESCNVSCLLNIEMFHVNPGELDQFFAFSMVGSDGFHFSVASNHLLLLCDLRRPLMPLLRWAHRLRDPSYITAYRLSELRSHSKDDKYDWASETGYGILVGSFCNCEFSLFCFGPNTRRSVASQNLNLWESFYAWELPSELSVAAHDCHCGSCLVKREFSNNSLHESIIRRHPREVVLGFGILDKDLSALFSEPDSYGGFMLIRLTSMGILESQRYCASWEHVKTLEEGHNEPSLCFEDSPVFATEEKFRCAKQFQYLKLDRLNNYLKSPCRKDFLSNARDKMDGSKNSDSLFDLKFDACAINFGTKESKAYSLLKRQYSKFQEGFIMNM